MFDPGFSLEIINGAAHIAGLFFLWHLGLYLYRETRRRHLSAKDWFFGLPVSMHLAVAILVCDIGVWLKAVVVWIWRAYYGAGQFSATMLAALWVGSLIIVVGSLCKIRAITRPDHGDGPWLIAAGAVAIFVMATIIHRNFLYA